jgi:hypothetical protein
MVVLDNRVWPSRGAIATVSWPRAAFESVAVVPAAQLKQARARQERPASP